MADTPPVSLRDIAKIAKVSTMTVSLSLRNDPSISKATRERVCKVAKECGYRRDPLLSAYGQQIRRRKSRAFHSTLAWFHDWTENEAYKTEPWLRRYWAGARERAETLGFALDPIWLREPKLNARRLHDILQARGIRGFVVHQLLNPEFFKEFPLDAYAGASIGQNLLSPHIPRVLADAPANALIALEQLVARGYRRIGFFQNVYHTAKTQAEGVASVYFHAYRLTGTPPIPPFFFTDVAKDGSEVAAFKAWLEAHEPDVILTENDDVLRMLDDTGYRVPQQTAVAHLEITDVSKHWSGIDPGAEALGATAVDTLVGQLFRNELGAQHPHESLRLVGRWVEGETTHPLPGATESLKHLAEETAVFSYNYFRKSLINTQPVKTLRHADD